jgi:hypothetical protein
MRRLSIFSGNGAQLVAVAAFALLATCERGAGAADLTLNISLVSELDPYGAASVPLYYGDVWALGDYAYVGSDVNDGGVSIFNISNPASPQFVTKYAGHQMEDVEVYGNIGYFSSDVSVSAGTGVDIVDLTNPASPVLLSRINGAVGGHNKVHTIAVDNGLLYTCDNDTSNGNASEVIKVWNVANPAAPTFVTDIDLNLNSNISSHEVIARDGRLYVASKNNSNNSGDGWSHIFDVTQMRTTGPILLKAFQTGGRTHTSHPSPDGKYMVVAQERPDGDVRIYDISMIDQPSDPDTPVLLKTLNRTTEGIDAHSPHHPMIHGDLMFMAWYEAGLQIYNMIDPANPVRVAAFDTYAGTSTSYNGLWGVYETQGLDRIVMSDRTRGLMIVNAEAITPTADFNFDDRVDGSDFLIWQRNLGTTTGAMPRDGDATRDGKVGYQDLWTWQKYYGVSGPIHPELAQGVPEGGTAAMALTAAAALSWGRKRRGK